MGASLANGSNVRPLLPSTYLPSRIPFFTTPLAIIRYSLYSLYINLLARPIWALQYSLFPSSRPQLVKWSLSRAIALKKSRSLNTAGLGLGFVVGVLDLTWGGDEAAQDKIQRVEAGLKRSKLVWMDVPKKEKVLRGVIKEGLARNPEVELVKVPGFVAGEDLASKAREGRKVGLHFHGGAYAFNNAHEQAENWTFPQQLAKSPQVHAVVSVHYRVATFAPHPAQLLDALTAYHYLVETLAINPKDIIVTGDSAGAHLALMLLQFLKIEKTQGWKLPGAAILLSPWCDMTADADQSRKEGIADYIDINPALRRALPLFWSHNLSSTTLTFDPSTNLPFPVELNTPYFSPAAPSPSPASFPSPPSKIFEGYPRMFIGYGGAECFTEDAERLVQRMLEAGVDVRTETEVDGVHDWVLKTFGGDKEGWWRTVGEWI